MNWLDVATSVLACALASSGARAASIYLNGVNIDGVTQQKFEKATIRIDEKGDIYIDAPGYAARVVEADSGGGAPAGDRVRMAKRYWLVADQSVPGMAEYDIDLYVNAKWVRKLKNSEPQLVTEVTKYLGPGKNLVTLTAHKVSQGTRKSFSGDHFFEVVIGEGNAGAGSVMIENPLLRFKVSAAQSEDESKEFLINAR
jgi:hypothetical protein